VYKRQIDMLSYVVVVAVEDRLLCIFDNHQHNLIENVGWF